MPTLRIPTPLRGYTEGQTEVAVTGRTVAEAMDSLTDLFPTLRPHLYDGNGQIRPFVNLFINDENVRDLDGLDTELQEDDCLMIIPSIAGG